MDVGQRPSRQRRHLPTNVTSLQQHESPTALKQQQQQQQHHDTTTHSDNDDQMDNYQSQHSSRVRKRLAKKRMQQNFGHWVTSSKKGSAATMEGSRFGSIQWRVWFWRLCVLWLAFLILRIVISIWQGDTTRLGLNQYLSQMPWIW